MTLKNIVAPKIKIELFGKKYNCEMKLRNYAVLRERAGIKEHELLQGLIDGKQKYVAYAIWASTLKFAPFDETDPLKLLEEVPMEKLFTLSLQELNILGDEVVKAIQAALPEPSEKDKIASKKKKKTADMK